MVVPLAPTRRIAAGLFFGAFACFCAAATAPAIPRFTHPGAGQTYYFVLTDRFANGDPANDRGGISGGREENGFDPADVGYYHGGDLKGLTSKLDYLQALGITAVWLTPPFRNNPVQNGSAGYHGYWITDFLNVDPHIGTNDDYRDFVRAAHARGMRVILDIVCNHTGDIVKYADGRSDYVEVSQAPFVDSSGRPFDAAEVAFNGLGDPADFPSLSAARSFPHPPTLTAASENAKNPAWLNDVTLYHNRGNSTFTGTSSIYGDFSGLDDLFTENPRVVLGLIDVYASWIRDYGVDGFRIDTLKHVNGGFWQAFSPAVRKAAAEAGHRDFIQFGEVFSRDGDAEYLSEFSTELPVDTTLDFGFWAAARRFVSAGGSAGQLARFFEADDFYTDHDSNVHSTTTFIGNHDDGRWGSFLIHDNPGASPELLEALTRVGHGLLYLVRGQPVLYYGDEQGMIGRGGGDKQAREDMFAATAPDFRDAKLLGTTRTGADDKFDTSHPLYRFMSRLGALRAANKALRTGAMILRETSTRDVFAFSRVDRTELVEYLVVFNNSRDKEVEAHIPTSQPAGTALSRVFASDDSIGKDFDGLVADSEGHVVVRLAPLEFAVWRAATPLGAARLSGNVGGVLPAGRIAPRSEGDSPQAPEVAGQVRNLQGMDALTISFAEPAEGASITFTSHEFDGYTFPSRQEIRADVTGSDGVAEVTFALRRSTRPNQLDWLGTDDAPPYRVFWRPPPDLEPGETLEFVATVSDLRGHQASAQVSGLTIAPTRIEFGIKGAKTPQITTTPPPEVRATPGGTVTLETKADGTAPLEFQWLHDGEELPGATSASLSLVASPQTSGTYRVLVRNRAGTAIGGATSVTITGP